MTTNTCPLEDDEAVAFADWLRWKGIKFAHVANESRSSGRYAAIRGAKLKKMGQSKGVYDYEIFIPVKGVTGTVDAYQEARIELKRQKGGTVSPEQKEWGKIYEKAGIPNFVAKGAAHAIRIVDALIDEVNNV